MDNETGVQMAWPLATTSPIPENNMSMIASQNQNFPPEEDDENEESLREPEQESAEGEILTPATKSEPRIKNN